MNLFKTKNTAQLTSDQKLESELNKLEWVLSPARHGCEFIKLRKIKDANKQVFVNIVTLNRFNIGDMRYQVLWSNLYRTNPDIQKRAKKLEDPNPDRPFWVRILKKLEV